MKYIYRREDTGDLIDVDFETAMNQLDGYIQLPDGVLARRCFHLEQSDAETIRKAPDGQIVPIKAEIVSDALGVTCNQVAEMRADAAKNGFAVEFTQDPHEPTFYQLRASSWAEHARYMRHRGYFDKNGLLGSGAALSAAQLEQAAARVKESTDFNGGSPSRFDCTGHPEWRNYTTIPGELLPPLVDKPKPPGEDDH